MKVTQLCLTLCNPMDYSLPCSSVHRILQARILQWIAIPFSRGYPQPRDGTWVSFIAGGFLSFGPPGKPRKWGKILSKALEDFWGYKQHSISWMGKRLYRCRRIYFIIYSFSSNYICFINGCKFPILKHV